jgi:acyl-coenzyme A thioesterase PaaI-like protein
LLSGTDRNRWVMPSQHLVTAQSPNALRPAVVLSPAGRHDDGVDDNNRPTRTARQDAVGELGAALRELVDAAVRTGVSVAELTAAADGARRLALRLRAESRDLQESPMVDDPTTGERWYSPVYGPGNPVAPPLVASHTPDGRATGHVTLGPVHEGPPGLVHGGVVAALFDHMLARAVRAGGRDGMTATLTVSYRRPVRLGVPLLLTAKMVDADGRRTTARARLVAADDPGTTLAEADGLFVASRPDLPADVFVPPGRDVGA